MVALSFSLLTSRSSSTSCRSHQSSNKKYACNNRHQLPFGWREQNHTTSLHRVIKASASVVSEDSDGRSGREAISNPISVLGKFSSALYQFSRPHTMLGTALSVVSISLLALAGTAFEPFTIIALIQALVSALLMNIAIVGINQLYDIDIDKINKPYLPLASGALTPAQGTVIVAATAATGCLIGLSSGSPALLSTLLISLLLGVLYSVELPFMRWKRSPFLAAGCILAVRAIIVQLGFYTHMRHVMTAAATGGALSVAPPPPPPPPPAGGAVTGATSAAAAAVSGGVVAASGGVLGELSVLLSGLSPSVLFVIVFMLFFSVVIALFKDIPDVAGDKKAGVRTLSVRLGEGAVFRICVGMLTAAYVWAMAVSLTLPPQWAARAVLFAGHAVLCMALLMRARTVNTRLRAHLTDYYMFVWKLFYAEYLLIPLFG